MDKELYYTPTIDEFHVGFEMELLTHELRGWESHTFLPRESLDGIQTYLDKKLIRVKYLDKKDIESLGWKTHTGDGDFIKDEYQLYEDDGKYFISKEFGFVDIFIGVIKNKSELIKLMKQLGI